jgi:cell wall-associated NlpC family hydrolase
MAMSRHNLLQRYATQVLMLCAAVYPCTWAIGEETGYQHDDGKVTASREEKPKGIANKASELVMQAMGMLGVHYKRGGNSPEDGLDCSGLVDYVYQQAWGTVLPRTSVGLSKVGEAIKMKDLQTGDLVFFNTLRRGFSHVGIYLGEHKFIHAPSPGGEVRIESMDISYWKKRFNGARRIIETPAQKSAPPTPLELSGPIPY